MPIKLTRWMPGLAEPLFVRFAALAAAALAIAGVVLLLLRASPLRNSSGVTHAWKSYCSWLWMLPGLFLSIGLGPSVFIWTVCVLAIGCVKEFSRATGLYEDWWFVGVVYAAIIAFHWAAWIEWYALMTALPVFAVAVLLLIPALRNAYQGMLQKTGLSLIALIYLGWFLAHLAYLANSPMSYAYLPFLIIGVELNDVAAFTTGKLFGRHPLIANISPKKTTEGVLGSIAATALYVLAFRGWLPGFGAWEIALTILIICLGGMFGDLVISFIKRDVGIKDMGVFIPGHGGLLDRLDSLIFSAPLFFHMISHYIGFSRIPR